VYALSIFNEPLTRIIGVTAAAPKTGPLRAQIPLFAVAISVLGLATTVGAPGSNGLAEAAMFSRLAASVRLPSAALGSLPISCGSSTWGTGDWRRGSWLGLRGTVSTLIRWFPDRRGLASGMAIMGFGGGAMIAIPLSNHLMDFFKTPTSMGLTATFIAMAPFTSSR